MADGELWVSTFQMNKESLLVTGSVPNTKCINKNTKNMEDTMFSTELKLLNRKHEMNISWYPCVRALEVAISDTDEGFGPMQNPGAFHM